MKDCHKLKNVSQEIIARFGYEYVVYECKQGAKRDRYRKTHSDVKRHSSTEKKNCSAKIKFNYFPNQNCLKITECSFEHDTHEINNDDFECYPQIRNSISKKAEKLIDTADSLHCNRKHLLHEIQKENPGFQAKDMRE